MIELTFTSSTAQALIHFAVVLVTVSEDDETSMKAAVAEKKIGTSCNTSAISNGHDLDEI